MHFTSSKGNPLENRVLCTLDSAAIFWPFNLGNGEFEGPMEQRILAEKIGNAR